MMNEVSEAAGRHAVGDGVQTLSGTTFSASVLEGKGPIAVEFMSYGCSYCGEMEPVLQQVAQMAKAKGKIFRVNIAVEPELADSYGIQATPTFVMFLDGEEVGRAEGPSPTVSSLLTALTHPFLGRR